MFVAMHTALHAHIVGLSAAPRLQQLRSSSCVLDASDSEPFTALVQKLADGGATKFDLDRSYELAIAAAFTPSGQPKRTNLAAKVVTGVLKTPANPSAAHATFRERYSGVLTTTATQQLMNEIVDTTCRFGFAYEGVYGLGLSVLCDAFLPATCMSAADAVATREALCFCLGLDPAQVAADAQQMRLSATTKAELFASDDFVALAQMRKFRYTYAFGVGLVTLMRAVGENEVTAIPQWCDELNLSEQVQVTLKSDLGAPFSIPRVGRLSFDDASGLEPYEGPPAVAQNSPHI